MKKVLIFLVGWIFLLTGCGAVNIVRNYSKYPECQSETTQGDWTKCLKEKYGVEGGWDAYGIYNTKTGGIWDWKKEETKKEETIIPSIEADIVEKVKPSPTKKQKEIIPVAPVASTTGQYIPQFNAPVWNVGNTWGYRLEGYTQWQFKVERIEDDLYIVNDSSKTEKDCLDRKTLETVAYLTPQGEKIKSTSALILYFDFPLYVGKKWKRMVNAKPSHLTTYYDYLHEYRVVSYEDITVLAGTFKAFKIELNHTNYGARMASGKVNIWYSPDVKFYIKVTFEKANYWAGSKARDFELVSFNLENRYASPLEIKLSPQKAGILQEPQTPLPEKPQTITATPSATVTSPPAINSVIVTGVSANIRSGAGNEFSVITTVNQGDKLTLLGEYWEWFKVRLENGQEGWINNRFVK
jgi:hypothetical protein